MKERGGGGVHGSSALPPKCVYIDAEGRINEEWGKKLCYTLRSKKITMLATKKYFDVPNKRHFTMGFSYFWSALSIT